jgi:uncharacterized glyoxalase superfamily protein PhnB
MQKETVMQPSFESSTRNAGRIRNAAAIINVEDVEKTLRWYQDQLGLQVEFAWGDPVAHGGILAGGTSFHFSQGEPTGPTTAYMTLYVTELDALFEDIRKHDVNIVSEPQVMPWGMRAFMINDCNGSLVMFADPSTGE